MKRQILMLLLPALLIATPVSASESDHPASLIRVLNFIDIIPTRPMLVEAGAGADGSALMDVIADEELIRYTRVRAVYALGLFPSVEAGDLFAELATDQAEDVEVRLAAMSVLERVEIQNPAIDVDELLRSLGGDPSETIRGAAQRAVTARQP